MMMNSPNIAPYAHRAVLLNYLYAAKHGYGFMVTRCPDAQDMDKDWAWDPNNEYVYVWSKARMLAHALRMFDIVLYIDSDAFVWDFETTIESKVRRLMRDDTCMVFAQDCLHQEGCRQDPKGAARVNAGVILARRSPKMAEILEHWMQPDKDCAKWKYTHPREQACIDILRKKHYDDSIRIVPLAELNGSDGTWIRHYMATSAQKRHDIIGDQLLKRLGESGSPIGFAPNSRVIVMRQRPQPMHPAVAAVLVVAAVLLIVVLFRRVRRRAG